MISKILPADSFYFTCRYIHKKEGQEVLLSEGVRAHDYKLMSDDFEMQRQMRPSKNAACLHCILSFHPDEKPSDEVMKEIAKKYLEGLEIANTQYVATKHTDKAHVHVHIVANMDNNEGRSISDSYIGLRGKKIAQRLTEQYGLIPALEKNLKLTHLENLSEHEANRYKIYMAISENLPLCKTIEDLVNRLSNLGIETQYKYKSQTEERQGISFRIGESRFKGSEVDRKFSYAGLEKAMGLHQYQEIKEGQAHEVEELGTMKIKEAEKAIQLKPRRPHPFSQSKQANIPDEKGKDLSKTIAKTVEILTTSDEPYNEIPHELLQEERKKRKKPSHRR